jgi:hypothetical protein
MRERDARLFEIVAGTISRAPYIIVPGGVVCLRVHDVLVRRGRLPVGEFIKTDGYGTNRPFDESKLTDEELAMATAIRLNGGPIK